MALEPSATGDTFISGYLYKETKDGRWQRRWFETNGIYLTYYKSRKMEKLLAALSLPQVGEIKTLNSEKETGLFCMELNSRVYTLRATSNEEAERWVDVLTRLRKQGVSPSQVHLTDATSSNSSTASHGDRASLSRGMETSGATWVKTGKSFICC